MKKITSFLALFLMCFGMSAWAQSNVITKLQQSHNSKTYSLTSRFKLAVNGERVIHTAKTDPDDANHQFAFVRYGGSYYLYSLGAGKYVNMDLSLSETPKNSINGNEVEVTVNQVKYKGLKINFGDSKILNTNSGQGVLVNDWNTTDEGNVFIVNEVGTSELLPSVQPSILEANDAFGANMHWYTMSIRGKAVKYDVSEKSLCDVSYEKEKTSARLYAFVGSEQTGYEIYNYAAGADKILWSEDTPNDETAILMTKKNQVKDKSHWMFDYSSCEENCSVYNTIAYITLKKENSGNAYINERGSALCYWTSDASLSDNGSAIKLTPVPAEELNEYLTAKANITVEHKCGEVLLKTEKLIKNKDAALGDLTALTQQIERLGLKFVGATSTSQTAIEGTVVTYNYALDEASLPFTLTKDDKAPVWYMINMHHYQTYQSRFWRLNDDYQSITSHELEHGRTDMSYIDNAAYQWCIKGDAAHGFTIHNRLDITKTLNASNNQASVGDVSGDKSLWFLTKSAADPANGYCFQKKSGDHFYLNNSVSGDLNNGTLKYWGNADGGSSCYFFKPVELVENVNAIIKHHIDAPEGVVGSLLGLDNAQRKTCKDASAAYDASAKDENAMVTFANAVAAFDFRPIVPLDANKYYRIKNVMSGDMFSLLNGGMYCSNFNLSDVGLIWKFIPLGNDFEIQYVNTGNVLVSYVGTAKSTKYQLKDLGSGQYVIEWNNSTYVYTQNNKNIVFTQNPTLGSNAVWYLMPAESLEVSMHQVGTDSYSSLYLPFNVTMTDDVLAFVGKRKDNTFLMKSVEGGLVPAKNGVILKGTKDKYTLTVSPATDVHLDNELSGTNVDLLNIDPAQYLVLGGGTAGPGLYKPKSTTLKANKAFWKVAASNVAGLRFIFDDEMTGVEEVETVTPADDVYYDLSGRRVAHPTKGVYIKNGKKVYVK